MCTMILVPIRDLNQNGTVKKLWGSGRAEVSTNLVKDGNSRCSMLGARCVVAASMRAWIV